LADSNEAAGQNVLNKAPQKFHGGERHGAALIAVGVVFPLKGDVMAIEGEEAVIADRHPMGIPPEVAQDGVRATECWFRVDDPVGREERVNEATPLGRVPEMRGRA